MLYRCWKDSRLLWWWNCHLLWLDELLPVLVVHSGNPCSWSIYCKSSHLGHRQFTSGRSFFNCDVYLGYSIHGLLETSYGWFECSLGWLCNLTRRGRPTQVIQGWIKDESYYWLTWHVFPMVEESTSLCTKFPNMLPMLVLSLPNHRSLPQCYRCYSSRPPWWSIRYADAVSFGWRGLMVWSWRIYKYASCNYPGRSHNYYEYSVPKGCNLHCRARKP